MQLYTPRAIADFCARGEREAFGPLGQAPYFLVDLDADAGSECAALTGWLRTLPCPVIGIGAADSVLAPACDTVFTATQPIGTLQARIAAHPIAAMTLVQVLRLGEHLPPPAALTLESLAYATLQAGPEFSAWHSQHVTTPRTPPSDPGPPVLIDAADGILHLTLNRPSNFNAITVDMRDALCEAFALAALDNTVQRMRLCGAGRCFSVGGSLAEFGTTPDSATAHAVRSLRLPAASLLAAKKPLHVHVHGACIGGGAELAAFADVLTAGTDAFFHLPELAMGLIPGAGGTVSFVRRLGRQNAAKLILTGRRISYRNALNMGLVDAAETEVW